MNLLFLREVELPSARMVDGRATTHQSRLIVTPKRPPPSGMSVVSPSMQVGCAGWSATGGPGLAGAPG